MQLHMEDGHLFNVIETYHRQQKSGRPVQEDIKDDSTDVSIGAECVALKSGSI
jgi:hypothetical protein